MAGASWFNHICSGNDGYFTTMQLERGADYDSDGPSITPNNALVVESLNQWGRFTETATTSAGANIRYQISPTGADPWYYWNGNLWAVAGPDDRNVSTTMDKQLWSFSTSTRQLYIRAFLESDGSAQSELDEITLSCANFQ